MTIYVNNKSKDQPFPSITVSVVGHDDVKAFIKLVNQGTNLEPNIPASMKELADLVTNGEILQPYKDMPK